MQLTSSKNLHSDSITKSEPTYITLEDAVEQRKLAECHLLDQTVLEGMLLFQPKLAAIVIISIKFWNFHNMC